MLLSLRNDHKEHLCLLASQSTKVIADLCKLTSDFLKNGPNNKLYKITAQELEVESDVIQNCVFGLVNLLMICCKHQLIEADFRDSILTLGFNSEQQSILYEFYKIKASEINALLGKQALQDHYKNIEWRFENEVSSRSLLHQINPLIPINLSLQSDNETKNKLLQTDPTNLVKITNKLKSALDESRTRYSRKIQNAFLEA